MNAKQIIKELMNIRGWSQSKLAEESGFKSQSNITGILNRGTSLRVDNFVEMANALGYEVVVRDKMGSGSEWKVSVE